MRILHDSRNLVCFDFNQVADVSAKSHKFSDTHVELHPVTEAGKQWFNKSFGLGAVSVKIAKNAAIEMAHSAAKDNIKISM